MATVCFGALPYNDLRPCDPFPQLAMAMPTAARLPSFVVVCGAPPLHPSQFIYLCTLTHQCTLSAPVSLDLCMIFACSFGGFMVDYYQECQT